MLGSGALQKLIRNDLKRRWHWPAEELCGYSDGSSYCSSYCSSDGSVDDSADCSPNGKSTDRLESLANLSESNEKSVGNRESFGIVWNCNQCWQALAMSCSLMSFLSLGQKQSEPVIGICSWFTLASRPINSGDLPICSFSCWFALVRFCTLVLYSRSLLAFIRFLLFLPSSRESLRLISSYSLQPRLSRLN